MPSVRLLFMKKARAPLSGMIRGERLLRGFAKGTPYVEAAACQMTWSAYGWLYTGFMLCRQLFESGEDMICFTCSGAFFLFFFFLFFFAGGIVLVAYEPRQHGMLLSGQIRQNGSMVRGFTGKCHGKGRQVEIKDVSLSSGQQAHYQAHGNHQRFSTYALQHLFSGI